MLEDNYNNNSQTVQLKIADYIKLSKEDRQKHIDLTTECKFYVYEKDWGKNKAGDLYGKNEQMKKAKNELLKELGIEDFGGSKIHLCHLCSCDSGNDKICINPLHTYFGTASENMFDKPIEVRQKGGKIAGKIGIQKLTKEQRSKGGSKGGKRTAELCKGGFKQKVQCPYCSKEGQLSAMKVWHFDNCKHKPVSTISTDISNLTPESSSANLE